MGVASDAHRPSMRTPLRYNFLVRGIRSATIGAYSNFMATKQTAQRAQSNSSPFHILGDTLESAAENFEEATANAHDSAKRAAEVTKSALTNALYKTCYGLSYGAVFSSVFLVEMMPSSNTMRRGFTEGAEAALEAVERKTAVTVEQPIQKGKRAVKPRARASRTAKPRPAAVAAADE